MCSLQLAKTLPFSTSRYVAWLWRNYMHLGGLTNRKLSWGFIQFGCSGIYVYGLQTLPCRSTLLPALWCRNVFQEWFHPWCLLTKHGLDQKIHSNVNISCNGQQQRQVGSGEAKSQWDIFSNIRYVKSQMQDSILIDTQSKQKFSTKDTLSSAYIIKNHHMVFLYCFYGNHRKQN